jgi:hypothetical protein
MSTVLATRPTATTFYVAIPTTTQAKRKPETVIEYDAPVLAIRKGRAEELYDVAEIPCGYGFDGRGFQLRKDRTEETYGTFISRNGQDHICDCRGFEAHNRCKHHDAIQHLIESGKLDHPEAGRPVEPWPSPEQLAADAGVELPY